jgi:hypothetical protein
MRIILSTLVLPAVIASHVQLPIADEMEARRTQHVDGDNDVSPLATMEGTASKLSGNWFDKPSHGPSAPDKQST